MAGQMTWAEEGDRATRLLPPAADAAGAYPITPGRIYQGKSLEAVGMPVGGIGTGSIWLDGQGKLGVWQIFNNLSEPRIPDSFFAVRARTAGGKTVTRVLQTEGEGELEPMSSLQYEGSHPIARLTFQDAELPVQVQLEAMNPMIPLDTANSSIPGGLFRLTAKNPGNTAVDVSFCATLQNAVGSGGANGIQGVRFPGYGGNRNRVVRRNQQTTVAMERSADPVPTGSVKVRKPAGARSRGRRCSGSPGCPSSRPSWPSRCRGLPTKAASCWPTVWEPNSSSVLARMRATGNRLEGVGTVFEDFEGKAYEGWEIDGPAFGDGPSHGTEPGQQQVTGFAGRGLVNTFQGGDGPQGTATSKTFTIQRRYLGFLIGGGDHKDQTCINLRVDGKVVRTAVGKNREALEPASWDLADLQGKQAVIEIVDKHSEGWGHINIDRILFSDIPPEPFLTGGTALEAAAEALNLTFESAEPATIPAGQPTKLTEDAPTALSEIRNDWSVTRYTRLTGFDSQAAGYRVLATTASGDPLVIEGPLGKGRIILALAPGLPWSWGSQLLLAARTTPLEAGERIVPGASALGTMALAVLDAPATALPAWTESKQVVDLLSESDPAQASVDEAVSEAGQTINAALAVPFTLQPGESRSVTFALTWHFPNVQRFQHSGNLYSRRWPDAPAVADYLADNLEALWGRTRAVSADAVPVEPAGRVSRRHGHASRDLPRADLFLVRGRLLRRFRRELRLLPAELHPRLELRPNSRPPVPRRGTEHASLELRHLPVRNGRDVAPRARAARRVHRRPLRLHRRRLPRVSIEPGPQVPGDRLARREEVRRMADRQDRPAAGRRPPRASTQHLRHVGLRGQHVHRLSVSLRPGSGRTAGAGDERSGQCRALASHPRSRHEAPGRDALQRRVLHSDPRSPGGTGL